MFDCISGILGEFRIRCGAISHEVGPDRDLFQKSMTFPLSLAGIRPIWPGIERSQLEINRDKKFSGKIKYMKISRVVNYVFRIDTYYHTNFSVFYRFQ